MRRLFFFAFVFLLGSCNPYPRYRSPCVYAPPAWKEETTHEVTPCVEMWWEVFEDEALNELEQQAIHNSPTLDRAVQILRQAKALAVVAGAPLYPQLSLNPSFTKQDYLFLFQGPGTASTLIPTPSIPGSSSLSVPSAPSPGPFRIQQAQYSVPLNVSYDVDIWNQIRNGYNASIMTVEAKQQALNNVLITITANVAQTYFQLRALDSEKEVLEQSISIRHEALDVTSARYQAGLVNFTDVSRAETEFTNAKADFEDTVRRRILQEDLLATLTGQIASEFTVPYNPLGHFFPTIPAGMPSELLLRRPDLLEAERNMASTNTQIGVQYASYFPSLILGGAVGVQSPLWHNLFDWKTRLWSISANIAQMVFDGGTVRGNVEEAKAVYMQNVADYEELVLNAFQEVEDALANIKYYARQADELEKSVASAKTTLDLSTLRYQQGLVYYLEVVDAQRSFLDTQSSLVKVQGSQFLSTVQLIKALGGSWE